MSAANMAIEIADGRRFFWQWDTGCKLRLVGATEGNQVHFYRDGMTEPLILPVYALDEDILCNIPDEILQDAKTFAAYTYVIGEDGNKTYVTRTFVVEGRPKPVDYIYTPTEKYNVNKAVEEAIEKALNGGLNIEGNAIIDVEELPTEDINTALFYRTPNGTYWFDGEWHELANGTELIAEIERLVDEAEDTLSQKIDHEVARQDEIITENKAIVEQANATSEEAKEIAEAISGIATESLKVANRAYEEKQDILAFDGEYNADRNKVATVETVTRKVAEIVANAPEDFDTLKELADWLTTHGGEAAQMNSAIKKNADDIVAERERATEAESSLQESIAEASRQIEENIIPQIVNADYDENDPTSKAYIENRPFYEANAPENAVDIRSGGMQSGYINQDCRVDFVSAQIFTKDELLDKYVPFYIDVKNGDGTISTFKLLERKISGVDNITIDCGIDLYFYIINDYENFGSWGQEGAPTQNGTYFVYNNYDGSRIDRLYREGKFIKKIDNKFIDGYDKLKEQADETEIIAKGANPAQPYDNYQKMVSALNNAENDEFYKGQNIYIVTVGVPDLWIKDIVADKVYYDYNSYNDYNQKGDQKIVQDLHDNGYIQVGYYQLARLETQKVYLQDYVKNTDYAVAGGAYGLIKLTYADSGGLHATPQGLRIQQAQSTHIDAKKNEFRPITPAVLDYAVKVGVTTNTKTLTDTEKASAQKWLFGSQPIDISYSSSGASVPLTFYSNAKAYLVSEKVYYLDELLGATVKWSSAGITDVATLNESSVVDNTNDGITFKVANYNDCYMFVAYSTNYKPSLASTAFPKAGVYFSYFDDGDNYYVSQLTKAGNGITPLGNQYLDLENNAVIKALVARIEALEAK